MNAVVEQPNAETKYDYMLDVPSYNPERFLDTIIETEKLKNDAALSRRMNVAPPVISKYRNRNLPISATFLIQVHEDLGWSFPRIRKSLGLPDYKAFVI